MFFGKKNTLLIIYTPVKSISALPPHLLSLILENDSLTTIITLPSTIKYFDCRVNKITSLPRLPDSLVDFDCTTNNLSSLRQVVVGSFDPNDKLVDEGIKDSCYVLHNTTLTYTIRFQNSGTDTAFNIVVRDTLNAYLNVGTLNIISSSHKMHYQILDGNIVSFSFDNILLPDSNKNELDSHGYIKFSISPNVKLDERTIVKNKAYIYFDFNPPICTNEVMNTFVSVLPVEIKTSLKQKEENAFTVYPIPVKEFVNIELPDDEYIVKNISIVNSLGTKLPAESSKGLMYFSSLFKL